MFGKSPRDFFKQAGLRIMVFSETEKAYQARLDKTLDGPILARFDIRGGQKKIIDKGLVERAIETIEPFIFLEANEVNEDLRVERRWLYPHEAIREALVNALAHREILL